MVGINNNEKEIIGPKSPKQAMMLSVEADIACLGGAAKQYWLR